jgi:hypothetical protein
MTTPASEDTHFLLLSIDLWTKAATVVGIFATALGAADAARSATHDADPGPQRFLLEEWHGTVRQSRTTLRDLHTSEVTVPGKRVPSASLLLGR